MFYLWCMLSEQLCSFPQHKHTRKTISIKSSNLTGSLYAVFLESGYTNANCSWSFTMSVRLFQSKWAFLGQKKLSDFMLLVWLNVRRMYRIQTQRKKHKTLIILSLTHTEFINQSDLFPRPLIYSAHGRHLVSFHHHKIYALATFKQPAARQRNEHST